MRPCRKSYSAWMCKGAGRCQGSAAKRPRVYVHAEGVGPTEAGRINRALDTGHGQTLLRSGRATPFHLPKRGENRAPKKAIGNVDTLYYCPVTCPPPPAAGRAEGVLLLLEDVPVYHEYVSLYRDRSRRIPLLVLLNPPILWNGVLHWFRACKCCCPYFGRRFESESGLVSSLVVVLDKVFNCFSQFFL